MMELRDQLQETLGNAYTLERELGGGGMSRVFVSEERALGRKVVVKVLPPTLSGGVNIERFKREIQVAARLQHAHIVPVLTAGETHGLPFYTMPFVDGESLRGRIARGPLPLTETISILRDVARALAYAHDHGVVHRDIKPDNVMLSGGSAVVADFGIAKAISAARTDGGSATLTQLGTSLGTPAYMAPEQAAADPATDHRADLYAFGCMAYEMLTGAPPFVEKSPQQLLAAHMAKTPDAVTLRRPDVPPTLATLITRCLEKSADDRPPSAADVVKVLDTVTSGGGHDAMPAILLTPQGAVRRALLGWVAAFIIVGVLARAAIVVIGLPDWVFPGALFVMTLGLPVIGFTWYVHHVARRTLSATPTYTPGGSNTTAHGPMATMAMKASPHVSWRRTAMGGIYAVVGFSFLVAVFMTLRSLGIGSVGSLIANKTLSANDQILVAEFTASGPDSSLGPVLSDAMRASLAKSRRVQIVQTSGIAGAFQRMGKPVTTRLTLPVAQELAQREGIKAIVTGEISSLSGGGYLVNTKLLAASTGDVLASFQQAASGAADLIPIMDKLGRDLRGKIGESLRDVQNTAPLQKVTTASLEALRKFSEGAYYNDVDRQFDKAIPALEEAIRIDSNFAMAYRKLAISLGDNGQGARAESVLVRGYRLRDKMPEAERLAFEGVYYQRGPDRDRNKVIESYTTLFRRHPEWLRIITPDLLAETHNSRREFAVAESLWALAMREAPDENSPYFDIVGVQVARSKLGEAKASLDRAALRQPPLPVVPRFYGLLAYNEGNLDSARSQLERVARGPASPVTRAALNDLVAIDLGSGQLSRALGRIPLGSGETMAIRQNSPQGARVANWLLRRPDDAIRRLDALAARRGPKYVPTAGDALNEAELGRTDRANAILSRLDSVDQAEPAARLAKGFIALAEKRPLDALREFRAADQGTDGPISACYFCVDPFVGLAFDQAGMADSAIATFEHFVNAKFILKHQAEQINLAWIRRRLAQLYEANGNTAKAREHYLAFAERWKNADPELQPQVASALARVKAIDEAERRRR